MFWARIFPIRCRHLAPSLFCDGLALGALAYLAGYLILGRLAFLYWRDTGYLCVV
jgi:hypothetical protein